jgi:gamma-glutamyltranspeptidase/glutathione hydrolase
VLGSPGGPRIISSVLETIQNVVDFGMDLADAVAFPRFHHQWLPDTLYVEPGISPDTVNLLRSGGYTVERGWSGEVEAIAVRPDGWLEGATDPRVEGKAAGY